MAVFTRDGEGCGCLHLAAQFGHTSLVAYLVAKGQNINTQVRDCVSMDSLYFLMCDDRSTNGKEEQYVHYLPVTGTVPVKGRDREFIMIINIK